MKEHILPALRLTLVCLAFFSGIYTAAVWGVAQILPNKGRAERLPHENGYYYANVGQAFRSDRYFWPRPSAVGYNAAGSAGSNKGPTNPDYLAVVQTRIDTFLAQHPGIRRAEIPADIVTASGSGLDPHISPQAANVQAGRVAQARGMPVSDVAALVQAHTEKPWLGFVGNTRVNVLRLNLALDQLTNAGPSNQNGLKPG
ncbi:MAG: K(+)-transporting ATPase subunit C [Saprospirales bacterium]|jgi:K+-transporting ATPase ATPase C chain|nr:K(+)-transporting ATPase subunit C [Saprospirales bacterium]MBK8923945.1 K(+)-transporting ATPase subunit C [Saprospirales bacterium]